MSLHKFAEQVASQGRGDDSLLVHMTPDEVRNLQQFAQAHGTTLTINPTTGLPEAGLLSDLFKAVAPIALGAFLGPGAFGIAGMGMSAGMAGAAVGGITTLATGSLSRGLMAGLGAYGGAGLAEGFMGAGVGAAQQSAMGALTQEQIATQMAESGLTQQGVLNRAAADATTSTLANTGQAVSSGFKAATANPAAMGAFAKNNLANIGMAAAPLLAMQPTTKMPEPKDTGYIRQFDYNINPDTGKPDPLYGMRAMTPVKASEFGNKTFQGQRDLFRQQTPNPYELGVGSLNQPPQQPAQMNTGGIVALADGGDVKHFAIGDLVKADIDAAYAKGDYGRVNELAQENKITAADVADTYKGFDTSGLAGLGVSLYTPPAAPTYTQYTPEQIGSYLTTNPTADIAAATKTTNADPAAVNAYLASIADPFRGSTDTTGGSGVLGIYNQMTAQGIDPTELYKAELANDPKYAGYTQPMIQKAYDLSKGAYALSAAQKGVVADKDWVKFMDDNKYSIDDAAQAFGLSRNEVKSRYDAVKAAGTKTDGKTTVTGGTGNDVITGTGAGTGVVPGGTYGSGPATGVDYRGNTVSIATPGDIITNPDGTRTVAANIPGRQPGGFTGIEELKSKYTAGGGSLGYTAPVFKTAAEHNAAYNKLTDDSLDAYSFLMGKGKNLTQRKAETRNRPVSQRYDEAVLGRKIPKLTKPGTTDGSTVKGVPGNPQSYFDETAYLAANPDVAAEVKSGKLASAYDHYLMYGKAEGRPFTGDYKGYTTAAALANAVRESGGDGNATTPGPDSASPANDAPGTTTAKTGGMMGYAVGGGLGSLGSYSDGGRLLRGPGDGVSDSIPATIGQKQQPARLADGEFVIPARIVSELGNGSTDAGAKKLYAMMDRVQRARGKTTGKNKVAANSRSDKYLPA